MSFLIVVTGLGAKLVLVGLLVLSVWSISIIVDRRRALRGLADEKDAVEARRLIRSGDWKGLGAWCESRATLSAGALQAALEISSRDASNVDRAVKSYLIDRRGQLEKGFTVLATLGSNAPFIGLFGTVLGIIQAFGVLSNTTTGSATVMGALAEALVATAVGLFVAIPALVAYNVFSRRLKLAIAESESLRDLLLSRSKWAA